MSLPRSAVQCVSRSSFHPLTNRKHHCRLCGRIICSLPVKFPQRPETCSLLFVVDQNTGRIEEVGEGVDYGVRRRSATPSSRSSKKGEVLNEDEKFLKGVRICRDCRPVLLYVADLGVPVCQTIHAGNVDGNSIDKRWASYLYSRDCTMYARLPVRRYASLAHTVSLGIHRSGKGNRGRTTDIPRGCAQSQVCTTWIAI